MKKDSFYTPTELAESLKVNVMTIYRYIKAGRLVVYKLGKEYRIDRKEFERFLKKAKKRYESNHSR